jgi:hypothetical protein
VFISLKLVGFIVCDRTDPRLPLARWRASQSSEALWAASKGDVRTLLRLYEGQFNLEAGDYDKRTPMHIAAANKEQLPWVPME